MNKGYGITLNRPKPPTRFDFSTESYHQHNRYFNEAEKHIDKLELKIKAMLSFIDECKDIMVKEALLEIIKGSGGKVL